jgi:hypothetical protein
MDNTWYYTLSTIVQAMASIFALSATFLVFKLQTLDRELREFRNKAIKSLVYIEGQSETKYDKYSLVDIAKKFSQGVEKLKPLEPNLGIDRDKAVELRNKWVMMVENGFAHVGDKNFGEYFFFLLKQNAKEFSSKVEYRINLYLSALVAGLLLTFTMILALAMLSGLSHPLNIFGYSAIASIRTVSIFACLSIVAVLWTAVYAVWGDKY